jgi:single-strand DNA-binding protein
MINEAFISVTGYVATQPVAGLTKNGVPTLSMRVGWTPRRMDNSTGDWVDEPTSFASVKCFRKLAQYGTACLRKGDPIVLKGTLRVREYEDQAGVRRSAVDVVAEALGHDLSRGISLFTRAQANLAKTALEQMVAGSAAREPLPGDRADLDGSSAEDNGDADDIDADGDAPRDGHEAGGDGITGSLDGIGGSADGAGPFDQDEMKISAGEAELVGASL